MTRFNYATASTSSEASPCSNVPIICPRCPDESPAVWTYSLHAHFRERHRIQSPDNFPITICLSQSEKGGMRKVWNSRFKAQKQRKTKPKNMPSLAISEAHRARLYLQSRTGNKDIQEDDSGVHDVDFRGDSGHPAEDAMEWDSEREFDDDDGDGGSDDGDDDGDRDDDDEEEIEPRIEPTLPPSSPTWYPNASVLPIESSISAFKSTTTPQESSAQAQAQALESSTQPSTQASDFIAQPPESTAVKDVPLTIPTLAPLSPLPGPPSPSGALPEPAVSGRGCRLRKAKVLSLNMCTCGVTITDSEIDTGVNVMKCRVPGCETVWVRSLSCSSLSLPFLSCFLVRSCSHSHQFHQTCMDYEFAPKTWACDSCAGGTNRRRRRM
ncbi:hypothetical protein EDB92DRAFT_1248155 [Lactarius akahatsu]|uniref:Zinc finger PHD-type domain-containing protein n=1 Tax=Lactarius akahatsu TaxID=416441 RepID=A0AAD4Q1Y6_9AGAM|nr:hypothetical protein EDB92DRAFT_1248155 [Lactarius akahatsu]